MANDKLTECRHDWKCGGWTIDPQTSTCRVCRKQFVFWSHYDNYTTWSENQHE